MIANKIPYNGEYSTGTLDGGRIHWIRRGDILIVNVKGHLYNATSGTWLRDVILPFNDVVAAYSVATAGAYMGWLSVGMDGGVPKLMFRCDAATNQNFYGQIITTINS